MSEENKKQTPIGNPDEKLEREVRSERKFSLADAIGRLGGGDLLKGASPVTRKRQAELEIEQYLEQHLADAQGALRAVLLRRTGDSPTLLEMGYEEPLAALAICGEQILSSEGRLSYFVSQVDAEWGRMFQERPHFERAGRPPNPEDPYTQASVRNALSRLVAQLHAE